MDHGPWTNDGGDDRFLINGHGAPATWGANLDVGSVIWS